MIFFYLKERETIARKSHAAVSQLSELRNLTETMKEENEKLASSWKTLAEVSIQEVAFKDSNDWRPFYSYKSEIFFTHVLFL